MSTQPVPHLLCWDEDEERSIALQIEDIWRIHGRGVHGRTFLQSMIDTQRDDDKWIPVVRQLPFTKKWPDEGQYILRSYNYDTREAI